MGLEGCRIGRVQYWKSIELEGCRIGMCDFMDYIGSIIFGIFFIKIDFPVLFKDFQCRIHMFGIQFSLLKNIFTSL